MEKFWESKIGKLVRRISAMEIPVHAANACYFMVLAVFPTLVLMLGLLLTAALVCTLYSHRVWKRYKDLPPEGGEA